MKILYVYGKTKQRDIVCTLVKLGYEVEEYYGSQNDSCVVQQEIDELMTCICGNEITHLLSIHLLPNLSVAAYQTGICYITMLWDAPCLTMTTVYGRLDNVWVSTFDKMDYKRFREGGTKHVLYQPLTVDRDSVISWDVKRKLAGFYMHEISFVGRLYEGNLYDRNVKYIPDNMQKYFTSIMEEAAFKWDGINRIYGTVSKEIIEYIKLVSPEFRLNNPYGISEESLFEIRCLTRKIANIERICCLNLLAEQFSLAFYTDSRIEEGVISPKVEIMPPVEPGEAISIIYAGSKINLNISLKGIEQGTPLRIFDILGAGGFVLSSYCPETAELFEEDKEIVMFRTPEELIEKISYYLTHDAEREKIAAAGQKKVLSCYTHEKKLRELLQWVEKGGYLCDENDQCGGSLL